VDHATNIQMGLWWAGDWCSARDKGSRATGGAVVFCADCAPGKHKGIMEVRS